MKPKMKLDDLKVNSFITNVDDKMADTAKGGSISITITITVPVVITATVIFSCFSCGPNEEII